MSRQLTESGQNNAKLRPRADAVPEGSGGARWYLSNFEAFEKSLNGEASSGIHAIRKQAIARFAELGFPTTRDEEWKYTDVSSLAKVPFHILPGDTPQGLTSGEIEPFRYQNLTPNTMVWVNGRFSRELSTISRTSIPQRGVRAESVAETLGNDPELLIRHLSKYARYDDNAFTALSTAFFQDGAFLSFPDGIVLEDPIHLLFVSTKLSGPTALHPRNLILIGKNCQVSILESHRSLTEDACFTNAVTEILLGENSVLEYHQLQDERDQSFHVGTTHVRQQRSSTFTSHTISLGGALVRNNLIGVLEGEGAECTMNGLYVATGRQHIDNHTEIDHAMPHCNSHELYKGILAGRSKGVFNGKIRVRKDAQKTDAKQTNKNLVLSDNASVDTKPQLEIFANDVRCTHGATIGQLDEEAIFYLRSRGIGEGKARDMLIDAFAGDVIDRIKLEPLSKSLHEIIHRRLEDERAAKEAA